MSARFHSLKIVDARPETADATVVTLAVPEALREAYRFTQGQHLTLRHTVDDQPLRRSYSIVCSPAEYARSGRLRLAIKHVPRGRFSSRARELLRPGEPVDAMTPEGRFFTPLSPERSRHYVGFAAGSGITPLLCLMRTTLETEPGSRFTLVYGNRTTDSILFLEEIEALKNAYLERVRVLHVLSRQPQEIELFNGRIDAAKCRALFAALIPPSTIDDAFVCGPATMIDEVEQALLEAGVAREHVHTERFGVLEPHVTGDPAAAALAASGAQASLESGADSRTRTGAGEAARPNGQPAAELTVILDGKARSMPFPRNGPALLDVALAAGLDLPYACKSGVCCSCRARVLEGEVAMTRNYALEDAELARGFVLTCQSHPRSDRVVVSYDER